MGGAMISKYASQHEDKVDGIIFLGSYPADDFSTKSIPMLSIYGEVDALATVEKIENNKKFMSKNTTMHMIKEAIMLTLACTVSKKVIMRA